MNLRETLTKERENITGTSIVAGFYLPFAPFSHTRYLLHTPTNREQFTDSKIRKRGAHLANKHADNIRGVNLSRSLFEDGMFIIGISAGLAAFIPVAAYDLVSTAGLIIKDHAYNKKHSQFHSDGHLMATNPDLGKEYDD